MLIKLSKCSITNYNHFKFMDVEFNIVLLLLLFIGGFEQLMANLNKNFIYPHQDQLHMARL